jgi:hypothetical protein
MYQLLLVGLARPETSRRLSTRRAPEAASALAAMPSASDASHAMAGTVLLVYGRETPAT